MLINNQNHCIFHGRSSGVALSKNSTAGSQLARPWPVCLYRPPIILIQIIQHFEAFKSSSSREQGQEIQRLNQRHQTSLEDKREKGIWVHQELGNLRYQP